MRNGFWKTCLRKPDPESAYIDEAGNLDMAANKEKPDQPVKGEKPLKNARPEYAPDMPEEQLSKGEILKQKRIEKGMSLELVHESTKIPLDALRAIEEGYTVRTLSPFYFKGFLKIYAQFLGLDVSEVVEDYRTESLPEPLEKKREGPSFTDRLAKFFTKERKQKLVLFIGALIALLIIFKIFAFIGDQWNNRPRRQKQPQADQPVSESPARPATERNVAVASPGSSGESRPAGQNVMLTVKANEKCWIRVRADGEVVFQSTMRAGVVDTWSAEKTIEISGRNVDKLEFELNGKHIGTLGRKDRNANTILITKDGLSVTQ